MLWERASTPPETLFIDNEAETTWGRATSR
jgi:hypothetical protein